MSGSGYSGTPLARKLGIRAGMTAAIIHPPENYEALLPGLASEVTLTDASTAGLDFVHIFLRDAQALAEQLLFLRSRIVSNGMIWVSWPKKASGIRTDLSEDVVRVAGLEAGLVDVKVCAVDETWSALKFVIPKADR
ncbi:MAG TPA: DUF3052 family protein [Longimicrobiales bacterium]